MQDPARWLGIDTPPHTHYNVPLRFSHFQCTNFLTHTHVVFTEYKQRIKLMIAYPEEISYEKIRALTTTCTSMITLSTLKYIFYVFVEAKLQGQPIILPDSFRLRLYICPDCYYIWKFLTFVPPPPHHKSSNVWQ